MFLAAGKVKGHGVFAPEGAFEPLDFFDALAPLCSPAKKSADDMLLVTGTWDRRIVDWASLLVQVSR